MNDVLRWSTTARVPARQMITAALGMGGALAAGVASGHVGEGMLAAFGAMALTGVASRGRAYAADLLVTAGATTAGIAVGAAIGGHGWLTVFLLPLLVLAVTVLGGFSRTAIAVSARLATFLVIATGFPLQPTDLPGFAGVFLIGALWTVVVALVAEKFARQTASTTMPFRRTTANWQYGVRLALCLFVASAVGVLLALPKGFWIAVTVIIIVHRRIDGALRRPLERMIGTFAGVLLAAALLFHAPAWIIVLVVTALAAARPYLKVRNYALYATIMTPLVVLLMDFGATPTYEVVVERLLDTAIGCAIALLIGYLPWRTRRSRAALE